MSTNQEPHARNAALALDILAIAALVAAALMLAFAGERHRYSWFTELRTVVSLAWGLAAWRWWVRGWWGLTIGAAVIAYLFNPIVPVFLRRAQWLPIDQGVLLASLAGIVALAAASWTRRAAHSSEKPVEREPSSSGHVPK